MSNLADALAETPAAHSKPTKLMEALTAMDADDRVALFAALENPQFSNPALSKVLKANGYEISVSALKELRAGRLTRTIADLKEEYL